MTTALISIYYPSDSVRQHVAAIASQVDIAYICDNTPVSNAQMFADIDIRNNIRYICFHKNLGLSCAFNRVLKDPQIPWQDSDYVFFFDQDSMITEHHITRMISVFEELKENGIQPGCLGPAYFNTSNGIIETPRMKKALLDKTFAVASIITSSMLCTYGDLRQIDFFNERVFLDMADWDLCWRLNALGKQCCMTESVIFHHSVGSGERKIGPLKLRVGQPFREYYQIRECLYLLFRPYTPLKYRIRFIAMVLIRSPLHLIFLDQRKQRMHYIMKGLVDFFSGKVGALDSETANGDIEE